ncbi:MAG: response regulator [Ignavibacteriaceae bacterium]|nr:response regulator [Ignavibacteriaceae bacterium]
MTKSVLIVEDEAIVAKDYKTMLEKSGFKVIGIADTSSEAFVVAKKERPDIILMDINLKGEVSGIETAKIIYDIYKPEIVFITGFEEEVLVFAGIHYKYIKKPIYEWNLIKTLN